MASGSPVWNWPQANITIASSWTAIGVMTLTARFECAILTAAKIWCARWPNFGNSSGCQSRMRLGHTRRGQRRESRVEYFQHKIRVGLCNAHRWREPDYASRQAPFAEQQTHFPGRLEDLCA